MGHTARTWQYQWDGVVDTIVAPTESAARKAIREKHQLKWIPNGAKVVRMDGTTYTAPAATVLVAPPAPAMKAPSVGECCELCGHKRAKPKAAPLPAVVDTSTMTDREVFAYYKRTAPLEDARFALKHNLPMTDELRVEWQALADEAMRLPRTELYRRLDRLRQRRYNWLDAKKAARKAFLADLVRIRTARIDRLQLDPQRIPA